MGVIGLYRSEIETSPFPDSRCFVFPKEVYLHTAPRPCNRENANGGGVKWAKKRGIMPCTLKAGIFMFSRTRVKSTALSNHSII